MDLQLTPEQLQLRDASRRVLAKHLASLVERLPEPPHPDETQLLRDARALGWLGLGLPETAGGAGDFDDLAVVHEELGRGLAPSLLTTLGLAGRVALHSDPGPARSDLLEQLAAGSLLAAPALGEIQGPGSQPATTVTRTRGRLRLDGSQRHVVDAASVHELLVLARDTDTGALQLLRVQVDVAGVHLEAEAGMSDVAQARLTLSGASVDEQACLAVDASVALRAIRLEATVLAAARAVGGGRAVLERTVAHVSTRQQFGRSIGTFQAVQHQLADLATTLDGAGLTVARAAWEVRFDASAELTSVAACQAALAASEAFSQATLVAHQLHGGMGFVLDSPLHLWSARAVADPQGLPARRHLLDDLAASMGLSADHLRLPAHHRRPELVPPAG